MRQPTKVKPIKQGRPKSPVLEIADLGELKKKVQEIKKRKKGIYLKYLKRSVKKGRDGSPG